MKINDLRIVINETLSPNLVGFKHKKTSFEYVKKSDELYYIFRVYTHSKTDWIKVASSVFVGSPKINKFFNLALNRNLPVNGSTWGYGIRNEQRDKGTYNIDSEKDIQNVIARLLEDFNEIALPEFQEVNSLEKLEQKLNEKNTHGLYQPMSVSSACSGIIAAYMVDKGDFTQICDNYYEFCKTSQSKELAKPILETIDYLENEEQAYSLAKRE